MPFINIAKKKDGDQKVTPAELVNPQTEPVVDEQVQTENIPAQVTAEAPAVEPAAVTGEQTILAEAENNDKAGHEGSKKVPTVLPGQEVKVTEEGVREIKGPPLPGDPDAQTDEDNSVYGSADAGLVGPAVEEVSADNSSIFPADTPVQAAEGADPGSDSVSSTVTLPTDNTPAGTTPAVIAPPKEELESETLPPLNETIGEIPSANLGAGEQTIEETPATVQIETPVVEQTVEQMLEQNPTISEIDQINTAPSEEEVLSQSIDPNTATIDRYFDLVFRKDASDLHLAVGYPAFIRVNGILEKIGTTDLEEKHVERLLFSILSEDQKKTLKTLKEVDLSYEYKKDARFRINAYFEKGNMAAAFRYLPTRIRTVEELKLPPIVHEFVEIPLGFILVTGPTGSGKSTTIASMIQEINSKQKKHIITIEDPIEYVYPKGSCLVDQREMNKDTLGWNNALRAVLRQDPNIVVVGEMRDYETIAAAITVAETGHLVFATLHTNTAVQTIDRIIDVFPQHQQAQIRSQLSNVISAVISQRLIPVKSGGRRAVTEIMIGTPAVRNAIREGKTYQIDNIIQTSFDVGMVTLERALVDLIREGELTIEEAQKHTTRPEELVRLMKKA